MKRWLLIVGVLAGTSGCVHTERSGYHYLTDLAYPPALYNSGESGFVYAQIDARSDGSIVRVDVLDSSHPKFSRSIIRTVSRWRWKPWTVTADTPEQITYNQEFFFARHPDPSGPISWMHRRVRHLTCAKVNKQIEVSKAANPTLEPWLLPPFRHTTAVLARVATRRKFSDDQRQALGETFIGAIAQITDACRASPELRYRDVLPEQVQKML